MHAPPVLFQQSLQQDPQIEEINEIIEKTDQKPNQKQNFKKDRKSRLAGLRMNLKAMPVMSSNTAKVEQKIQRKKKRKESVQLSQIQDQLTAFGGNSPIQIKDEDLDDEDSPDGTINTFEEKYQMLEKIGQGVHGVVKKCYHKVKQVVKAVKLIQLSDEHIPILKRNFMDVKNLNHPNIIKHKAMYFDYQKRMCFLVMEYAPLPCLADVKIEGEQETKSIMLQLLDALAYMHKKGIAHRDIKPDNILYDTVKKSIKIVDFGICKNLLSRGRKQQMLTVTGTLYYRAPEMFHGSGYDEKVDLWAVGVTLYKMITGKTPFESPYLSDTINNIENKELNFDHKAFKDYSAMAINFIKRLIKRNRKDRMSATEAKKHFWFEAVLEPESSLIKSEHLQLSELRSVLSNIQAKADKQKQNLQPLKVSMQIVNFTKKKVLKKSSKEQGEESGQVMPSFDQKSKVKKFFDTINVVEEAQFGSDDETELHQ